MLFSGRQELTKQLLSVMMPHHLILAELFDLSWHREWEQHLRLLWLRRWVCGEHCFSDGTTWALDNFCALRNVCLVWARGQTCLLWEKIYEEGDQPRSPWQEESPPPWTRNPGLPEDSCPLNLHGYSAMVSPTSTSPIFPGGTAGSPSDTML